MSYTDTERLDFMLGYWGVFAGGATVMGGNLPEPIHEAIVAWQGFDSYGRSAHFITVAETTRDAIDLAIPEAEAMRGEDWEATWPDWMLTDEEHPHRRPSSRSAVELHREKERAQLSEQRR